MHSDELALLLEAAGKLTPFGAWVYEVDRDQLHWSDEVYRIFGREPGSDPPTRDEILSHYRPQDRRRIVKLLDRALKDGLGYEQQSEILASDGTVRYVATRGSCRFGLNGSVVALYGSIQDITHLKLADAELRASEARHRLITGTSQDLVVQVDRAGVIAFVSPSVQRWGYQASELTGRNIEAFIHPEDKTEALAWFAQLISAEVDDVALSREVRCLSDKGDTIWFEGTPSLIRDADEATGLIVILHDVTTRRELEQRAREQADLVEAAFQQAASGKALIGLDRRFLKVNAALCAILGLTESELLEIDLDHLTHPEELDHARRERERIRKGEIRTYQMERRYRHRDGSYVPVRVSVSMVRDREGAPKHYLVEVEDRTEYVTAESARRESEYSYRLLAENIGDVIFKTDMDGTIEYVSPSIKMLTGLDPNVWIGRHINERIVAENDVKTIEYMRQNLPLPTGRDNEFQYRRADGSMGWAQGNPTIIRDADDNPIGLMSVVRDVTERHAIEDELRRKTAEAEAAVVAKSEFLANTSHEIRTPLTAVIGFGDLLAKMADLPEKPRLYAERIARSGEALLGIVNSVLDFSRIEAGEIELKPQVINPGDLFSETLDQLKDKATEKGLALALELDGPIPALVIADRGRVGQVLTNLLTNAVKFTRDGGVTVRIGYEFAAQELRVSVSDTGIGIPEGQADRLFERFTQIDSSHTRLFGGVGLGLAISKSLVETMGGKIDVESSEGSGSTFSFTVHAPVATPAPDTSAAVVRDREVAALRILVVDDVAVNRELIAAMLEPFDLDLSQAGDGLAAVEATDREPFDLILMDIQMPRMNGLSATQAIRAGSKLNRATPILALSANVLPQQVEECLAAGMNDHVGKPINPEDLLTKIELWARPNEIDHAQPATQTLGDNATS